MDGLVTLDFSALPMNGIAGNYMDTLHSDYAFVLSPQPVNRRAIILNEQVTVSAVTDWDFLMFPNPANDVLYLRMLSSAAASDVSFFDLSGRRVLQWSGPVAPSLDITINHLAKGTYAVRVTNAMNAKMRILVIL